MREMNLAPFDRENGQGVVALHGPIAVVAVPLHLVLKLLRGCLLIGLMVVLLLILGLVR